MKSIFGKNKNSNCPASFSDSHVFVCLGGWGEAICSFQYTQIAKFGQKSQLKKNM
jgi:hypothetical protein